MWLFLQGAIFSKTGTIDDRTVILSPPKPIQRGWYRCDLKFHTDIISYLYKTYNQYGVILLNGQDTVFYTMDGDTSDTYTLSTVGKFSTKLQPKHDQGGQSQNRIARLREESITEYLKKINERALKYYLTEQYELNIKGLILVGTGLKKDQLRLHLDDRLNKVLLGIITRDSVQCSDILPLCTTKTPGVFELFESYVSNNPDMLCFGERDTIDRLKEARLRYVVHNIVDAAELARLAAECDSVGCTLVYSPPISKYGILCGILWYIDGYVDEDST